MLQYELNSPSQAAKHGYVETLCGRRLLIPEIHSRQPVRRKAAERAAINAPMQGSAADIIKKAMIQVASICNHQAKMIMQVYDELMTYLGGLDKGISLGIFRFKNGMGGKNYKLVGNYSFFGKFRLF